jgi:hypothetical protein
MNKACGTWWKWRRWLFKNLLRTWMTHKGLMITKFPNTISSEKFFTVTFSFLNPSYPVIWKENFGKLQIHCSKFHEWLIHLNTDHGWSVLPLQFSTGPLKLWNILKSWGLHRRGWSGRSNTFIKLYDHSETTCIWVIPLSDKATDHDHPLFFHPPQAYTGAGSHLRVRLPFTTSCYRHSQLNLLGIWRDLLEECLEIELHLSDV